MSSESEGLFGFVWEDEENLREVVLTSITMLHKQVASLLEYSSAEREVGSEYKASQMKTGRQILVENENPRSSVRPDIDPNIKSPKLVMKQSLRKAHGTRT